MSIFLVISRGTCGCVYISTSTFYQYEMFFLKMTGDDFGELQTFGDLDTVLTTFGDVQIYATH